MQVRYSQILRGGKGGSGRGKKLRSQETRMMSSSKLGLLQLRKTGSMLHAFTPRDVQEGTWAWASLLVYSVVRGRAIFGTFAFLTKARRKRKQTGLAVCSPPRIKANIAQRQAAIPFHSPLPPLGSYQDPHWAAHLSSQFRALSRYCLRNGRPTPGKGKWNQDTQRSVGLFSLSFFLSSLTFMSTKETRLSRSNCVGFRPFLSVMFCPRHFFTGPFYTPRVLSRFFPLSIALLFIIVPVLLFRVVTASLGFAW